MVQNVFITRQWSCGKVIVFTSVCHSVQGWVGMSGPRSLLGGRYALYQIPSGGGVGILGGTPMEGTSFRRYTPGRYGSPGIPLVPTSSSGHRSEWYTSYWNAFLLFMKCHSIQRCTTKCCHWIVRSIKTCCMKKTGAKFPSVFALDMQRIWQPFEVNSEQFCHWPMILFMRKSVMPNHCASETTWLK